MAKLDVLKTKTIRFARVVQAAGRPESYTLWTDPERDSEFQKALREQRVMTVLRRGSRSDAAVVGYLNEDNALYLVFPKTLKTFRDRRIIGLKYDLLTESRARGKPVNLRRTKPAKYDAKRARVATHRPEAHPPAAQTHNAGTPSVFRVAARIIMTLEREVEIQAKNQREARNLALTSLKETSPDDATPGTIQIRIRKVRKILTKQKSAAQPVVGRRLS